MKEMQRQEIYREYTAEIQNSLSRLISIYCFGIENKLPPIRELWYPDEKKEKAKPRTDERTAREIVNGLIERLSR